MSLERSFGGIFEVLILDGEIARELDFLLGQFGKSRSIYLSLYIFVFIFRNVNGPVLWVFELNQLFLVWVGLK